MKRQTVWGEDRENTGEDGWADRTARASAVRPLGSATNQRTLATALVPVVLASALCVGSAVQGAVGSWWPQPSTGTLTQGQAQRTAVRAFATAIGQPVDTLSVEGSIFVAGNQEIGKGSREWDVICRTWAGRYQARVDANSGRVFALNRIGEDAYAVGDTRHEEETEDRPQTSVSGKSPALPLVAQAEARARQLLRIVGVNLPQGARPLRRSHQATSDGSWDFCYSLTERNGHHHTVAVTLDGRTGIPQSLWNAPYSL